MRLVVNTVSTKKGSGGALQIAYNFLLGTLKYTSDIDWYYLTSSDVDELVGHYFESLRDIRYFVFPTQPDFLGSYMSVKKALRTWEEKYKPDVIYSISSPCYFSFKTPEVMRFANAWVTNPNALAWKSMPGLKRIKMYMYRCVQKRLLRRAKFIITQSETVRKGLLVITHLPEDQIAVVPNVLPHVFSGAVVNRETDPEWIDIVCAAAPVPHKNLDLIPDVLRYLRDEHNINNVRFHLTLPEGHSLYKTIERRSSAMEFKNRIINHGRCTQLRLIEVYNKCSMCFLPTLLETFSASSLEAMYFGHLIVATDFSFNREVIADAGLYYKPGNAKDAASQIASLLVNEELQKQLQGKMKKRIGLFVSYYQHFHGIVAFIKECVRLSE